jgi:hypothetical protein
MKPLTAMLSALGLFTLLAVPEAHAGARHVTNVLVTFNSDFSDHGLVICEPGCTLAIDGYCYDGDGYIYA